MSAKVYFADFKARNTKQNTVSKIVKLLEAAGIADTIKADDLCAIKIHFGEMGNDSHISPVFARSVVDLVRKCGAKPFLTDTNTLYKGSRANAFDHLETAIAHGFTSSVTNCPVIIADGLTSQNLRILPLNGKWFKSVKIAGDIADASSMVVMSHFKGHEMAGFGGAIKNLAMGCAPASGKRDQHSPKLFVNAKKCVSCGACVQVCPQNAISLEKGQKAVIATEKCIGCGECLSACAVKAIQMNWDIDTPEFMERMTEYALGAVQGKQNKIIYINFVNRVVPECDCCSWSDVPIVHDIGILASTDPVALDQACFDLVKEAEVTPGSLLDGKAKKGDDKFTILHPNSKGTIQLEYGEKLGLGVREYELVRL